MSPSTLPLCYIDQTAAPSPAAAAHPSTGSTHRTVGHKNQLVTLLNSYFLINLNVTRHYLSVTLMILDPICSWHRGMRLATKEHRVSQGGGLRATYLRFQLDPEAEDTDDGGSDLEDGEGAERDR